MLERAALRAVTSALAPHWTSEKVSNSLATAQRS